MPYLFLHTEKQKQCEYCPTEIDFKNNIICSELDCHAIPSSFSSQNLHNFEKNCIILEAFFIRMLGKKKTSLCPSPITGNFAGHPKTLEQNRSGYRPESAS